MARYLRAAGHSVTVIATDAFGTLPDDKEQRVVRAHDLRSASSIRHLLGRGPVATVGQPTPSLFTRVFVPDAHVVGWLPAAYRAARRLLAEQQFDCLVTSSPPDSTHLI